MTMQSFDPWQSWVVWDDRKKEADESASFSEGVLDYVSVGGDFGFEVGGDLGGDVTVIGAVVV